LLMTVIPAQVAGVKSIRVVSPKPSAEVLAAAGMLGVREFYRVGGAQAIAARRVLRESTRSLGREIRMSRVPRKWSRSTARLIFWRGQRRP
jgi:histidinol dehydrogenase